MGAPKGNQYAKGNKGGRPTVYHPKYAAIAEKACKVGFTDKQVAELLGISHDTIWRWKFEHQEFSDALKIGGAATDDRVEASFYHKAVGYDREVTKIFMVDGQPVPVKYTEHIPPDTIAGIFWLKNRRPDKWKDVNRIEHGGPGAFEGVSDAELVEMVAQEAQLLLEDKSKKEREES